MRKIHFLLATVLLAAVLATASAQSSGAKPPGGGLVGREIVTQIYWNETPDDETATMTASCPAGKVATGGSARVLIRFDDNDGSSTITPRGATPTASSVDTAAFTGYGRLRGKIGSTGQFFTDGLEVKVVCVTPAA